MHQHLFEWIKLQQTMNLSSTKAHAQMRLAKAAQETILSGEVPEHVRQLIIDNKRMQKRILVLQTEIQQKNRVIGELKDHLDQGVIESTQQKLSYYRSIEEAVNKQLQEAKQQMVEQALQLKEQQRQTEIQFQGVRQKLKDEIAKNQFLLQKIQSLKQYIIDIIEQKDYLIAELGTIISEQNNLCQSCINKKNTQDGGTVTKKKAAFIRKNQ